jgi:hypothetical protein
LKGKTEGNYQITKEEEAHKGRKTRIMADKREKTNKDKLGLKTLFTLQDSVQNHLKNSED